MLEKNNIIIKYDVYIYLYFKKKNKYIDVCI